MEHLYFESSFTEVCFNGLIYNKSALVRHQVFTWSDVDRDLKGQCVLVFWNFSHSVIDISQVDGFDTQEST